MLSVLLEKAALISLYIPKSDIFTVPRATFH